MLRILVISVLIVLSASLNAQTIELPVHPSDTIPPVIEVNEINDSIRFEAKLRPLRRVSGAPEAFYTYFWEFGDGRFSFEKNPVYSYRDTGEYQVRLYATNNYDDGKAPPTRPRPVKIKTRGNSPVWASHFFGESGNVGIKINRNPKPGEDFVALVGYRNPTGELNSGSLVFFYNERMFESEGFSVADKRWYNGEDSSSIDAVYALLDKQGENDDYFAFSGPSASRPANYSEESRVMLKMLQSRYLRAETVRFSNLDKEAENFLFMNLSTLPEMIKDTNATVTISVMMIPDNAAIAPELFELEMEIVASHDPNRLQLRNRRINYRFMGKKKEISYKVRFQNTGRGPAKRIAIGIAIPKQLNTQSLQVLGMSPQCVWCDSAYANQSCFDTIRTVDSVYFVFNNIYLPGLQQEGVTDKDSTKGYVEYAIRFRKKPKKIPFESRAAIYFDKNEPVYTNRATGRFIKGISPGIMAGYSFNPGSRSISGPVQLGAVLAPYAPSRPYFQFELYAGFLQEEEIPGEPFADRADTSVGNFKYMISGRQYNQTIRRNTLQGVPLHFRLNLNNWVSIGAGAFAQLTLTQQVRTEKIAYLSEIQRPDNILSTARSLENESTEWFTGFNAAPFADIQVGRVKQGPALGFRYMRMLKGQGANQMMLYGIFRL